MANTVINIPELLNLDSTTGATILAKGTVSERPPTSAFGVDYLVVAGGGASNRYNGGGAGAGGLRTSYGSNSGGGSSAESSLSLIAGTNYTVTVGEGGLQNDATAPTAINDGDASSIAGSGFTTIASVGGGAGGVRTSSSSGAARNGGSGGGGGSYSSAGNQAGSGTSGQGYDGANGVDGGNYQGGGGGGAYAAGTVPNGGNGLAVSITGTSITYAGGGGAGANTSPGLGGTGGGGNGSSSYTMNNGTANTGGGGGGGAMSGTISGGNGGSGVVILRYPNTRTITVGAGLTATTATVGTDSVTTFTAGTGTISFSEIVVGDEDNATNGTLRFNTDTNKTEYFDGTGWYEIVDEYANGFIGPATKYFDTKLYTGNGATQSIGGYINGSGSFNGSSSFINIDNSTVFDLTTYSVSFWIYSSNYNQSGATVYNGGLDVSGPSWGGLAFNVNSNKINYYGGDVAGVGGSGFFSQTGATNLTNGQWVNVVMIVNGTSITGYINGIQDTGLSRTLGANIVYRGQHKNTIGVRTGSFGSFGYFNGSIDQFRFYNTALSSADVTALQNETSATASTAAFPSGQTAVATYTMDTSANGLLTTTDLSTVDYPSGAGCVALYEMNGNSNDTSNTYNGTPTNISYQGGAFDQAAVFNGSSSKITVTDSSDNLNFSNHIGTISAWVNLDSISGGEEPIVCKRGSGNPGARSYIFNVYNGKVNWYTYNTDSNSQQVESISTLSASQWHHIAVTLDQTNIKIYIDGVLDKTASSTYTSIQNDGADFSIGYRGNNSGFVYSDGDIDQVRIFNTALTQAQVTTLARGIATSYSGSNTNVNFNGHLDFQPDFVWIKERTGSAWHIWTDSVRGANKTIYSNSTYQQESLTNVMNSFDNNGFTVGYNSAYSSVFSNKNNEDYVSWNWKAGGAAVANNEGTIASQVSANKDSGFSIVKYQANSTQGATIGHGLNSPLEMIITKEFTGPRVWCVYHKDLTSSAYYLELNTSDAQKNAVNTAYAGVPGSTTYSVGTSSLVNDPPSDSYVAYCWHSVAGYSKIGSYTGNGNATGPIVSLDFAPSFVMIKGTDQTSDWIMIDNKRDTTNPNSARIDANGSGAEYTGENIMDLNSNGFQLKTSSASKNGLNKVFIYMAFA